MNKYTLRAALALILCAMLAWSTPACALSLFGFGGDGISESAIEDDGMLRVYLKSCPTLQT